MSTYCLMAIIIAATFQTVGVIVHAGTAFRFGVWDLVQRTFWALVSLAAIMVMLVERNFGYFLFLTAPVFALQAASLMYGFVWRGFLIDYRVRLVIFDILTISATIAVAGAMAGS